MSRFLHEVGVEATRQFVLAFFFLSTGVDLEYLLFGFQTAVV